MPSPSYLDLDNMLEISYQVRDLAKYQYYLTRRKYNKIAKGLEALEIKVAY
jgi:hypothetical protein